MSARKGLPLTRRMVTRRECEILRCGRVSRIEYISEPDSGRPPIVNVYSNKDKLLRCFSPGDGLTFAELMGIWVTRAEAAKIARGTA